MPTSVGLSGLITPSLDEMVYVAAEMERRGLDAAAPDRRRDDVEAAHRGQDRARATARPTVHVLDASRVVGVVSDLLDPARRARPRRRRTATLQERLRAAARRARRAGRCCSTADAIARTATAARLRRPAGAAVHGHASRRARARRRCVAVHRLDVLLRRLGAEGALPEHPRRSRERRGGAGAVRRRARAARRDRRRRAACRRAASTASGPRRADGDDVVLGDGHAPAASCASSRAPDGAPEPLARRLRRARRATTSARSRSRSCGADELAARFEAEHDDYRAIMVKALADRLAEAFAEQLHAGRAARVVRARRAARPADDLIEERYRGIRPGLRLPGLPRPHREAHAVRAARRRHRSGSS